MVQISSFRLKFDSKNNNVLDIVKGKEKKMKEMRLQKL